MADPSPRPNLTPRRYRSFFWPAALIVLGVIALLINTGAITADRLYQLLLLWPLILIVIGLELLVRHWVPGAAGDVAAALILVVAVVGAAGYVAAAPSPKTSGSVVASDKIGNLEQASVEIDAGSAAITISPSTDLGENLYQAHIDYAGPKPDVELDRSNGSLRVSQQGPHFLQTEKFTLSLQLNASVRLSSLTINTGAGREEVTLGQPSGIVPVEINSGAVTVHIHRPNGVAASIEASGGAVNLDADGKHIRGIGDLTYASSNFTGASDGYRIRVNCGACTVTLDSTG